MSNAWNYVRRKRLLRHHQRRVVLRFFHSHIVLDDLANIKPVVQHLQVVVDWRRLVVPEQVRSLHSAHVNLTGRCVFRKASEANEVFGAIQDEISRQTPELDSERLVVDDDAEEKVGELERENLVLVLEILDGRVEEDGNHHFSINDNVNSAENQVGSLHANLHLRCFPFDADLPQLVVENNLRRLVVEIALVVVIVDVKLSRWRAELDLMHVAVDENLLVRLIEAEIRHKLIVNNDSALARTEFDVVRLSSIVEDDGSFIVKSQQVILGAVQSQGSHFVVQHWMRDADRNDKWALCLLLHRLDHRVRLPGVDEVLRHDVLAGHREERWTSVLLHWPLI